MAEKKVLVIDDSATIRKLVDTHLSPAGYAVTLAPTAEEGLQLAEEIRPDLILLDLMLPKKSGTEVLDELRADYSLKDIPVVVMTASDDDADRVKCQMLHVDAFISKPVNVKEHH